MKETLEEQEQKTLQELKAKEDLEEEELNKLAADRMKAIVKRILTEKS